MAAYETRLKTFSQRPYYDDFDISKKFYQILYRPGMAVQARELTQMQTIMQEQLARMGGHFFDNGSKIIGGETSVKSKIQYIKLPDTAPTSSVYEYIGGTISKTVIVDGNPRTLTGKIVHYIAATDTDPATIYIEYSEGAGDITSFDNTGVFLITVTNGGSGYTSPVVSISGTGSGASATATISSGVVTEVTMTSPGSGYTTAPTVTITGGAGTGAIATASLVTDNVTLSILNTDTALYETFTISLSNASGTVGYGSLVAINDGIYFINGRFVVVDKQLLVVSKYTDITATSDSIPVGFLVEDVIITPDDDSSLFDNAIGSTNEAAPGATRYSMNVVLSLKPSDDTVKNFIQLLVLESGVAATPQNKTDYSSIFLDLFATRTYDESGDYVINDFLLDVKEHLNDGSNRGEYLAGDGGDESKVSLTLDPGKAYVRGYLVETNTNIRKTTDKSRDVDNANLIYISNQYESFMYLDLTPSQVIAGSPGSLTTTLQNLQLFNRSTITTIRKIDGTALYSAVFMGLEHYSGSIYKAYFTALKSLSTTANLADVAYIDQSGKYAAIVSPVVGESKITVNQSNSKLIYDIPLSYVKNITGATYKVYRSYTGTITSDVIQIPADSSIQFSSDKNEYVIQITNVGYVIPTSVTPAGGGVTITLPADYTGVGTDYTVWSKVAKTTYSPKVKTQTNKVDTFTLYSSSALSSVTLTSSDIISINSITIGGNDVTANYILDNGQRDDRYDYGVINLKAGYTSPSSGTIVIDYDYFDHSSGDYFTVDSYSALNYKDIPSYNGTFLGNVIDLRSSVTDLITKIVPSTDIIIDYSYYLSRIDLIAVDNKQNFAVVRGVPSLNPKVPKDLDNSITLYQLFIPAYTFNVSDIIVTKLNYKRYTMKDISNLEKRIENLEYYTQLSLLESNIQGKDFLDKFKSGYIVDNFESLTTGDADNLLHTIAIDFAEGEVRPQAVTHAINVMEKTLTNCVNSNGIVTLPYTETTYIDQKMASTVVRIQPFAKYNWHGKVALNPSFDNWISYNYAPDLTLDAGTFPASRSRELPNMIWDVVAKVFVGREIGTNVSGTVSKPLTGSLGNVTPGLSWSWQNAIRTGSGWMNTTFTTQTNYVGTRIVDIGAVPFIRSRLVEFTITGLKPNTTVTPYFDGKDVSRWCFINKPLTFGTFNHWIYYDGSWNYLNSVTSTDKFTSNGAGVVHGYFFIPNNDFIRFKTGVRKFEVKDTIENPSTDANGYYVANGTNITMQNVFVTTRFVRTETVWRDPVAESFMISNPEGVFISSLDLYFGPEATGINEYVVVEIRNMINGYPGDQVIATVEQLVNLGSLDATAATRFTFEHPIYLEPNKEYSFVVMTNSTDLSLWCSELGQKSVRPGDITTFTGEYINKQPYLGSMFKSQNNTTWTSEQNQDIKFTLNRAKFNTGVVGSAIFTNKIDVNDTDGTEANIFTKTLADNPLSVQYGMKIEVTSGGVGYTSAPTVTITSSSGSGATATAILGTNPGVDDDKVIGVLITAPGSGYTTTATITVTFSGGGASTQATASAAYYDGSIVSVRHPNHGFKAGDSVTLTFAPTTPSGVILGDFTVADLTGSHTIVDEDIDSYSFKITGSTNTQNIDAGGGQDIVATQVIPYSNIRIMTDAIILNGTSLDWKVQTKGYHSSLSIDPLEVGVIEGKSIDLGELKVIKSDNDGSLQLKGYMTSSSDYLSPVIDEQRLTVYATANRINGYNDSYVDGSTTYYDRNNAIARYATKNVTLINPANELQVYLDLNLVTGTKVDVYCMVSTSPVSVSNTEQVWHPMTVVAGGNYTDVNVFQETKYEFVSDSDFTNFVIKVVFSTTVGKSEVKYRAVVPRGKRFRGIALKQ